MEVQHLVRSLGPALDHHLRTKEGGVGPVLGCGLRLLLVLLLHLLVHLVLEVKSKLTNRPATMKHSIIVDQGVGLFEKYAPGCLSTYLGNLFIYQARESSLVPEGFLTAQFLQKL